MNNAVKSWLTSMGPDVLSWLESLRNKNPLKGSNGGMNQNSVFVEIGKNLIVDEILEQRNKALNPPKPLSTVSNGSELMGEISA